MKEFAFAAGAIVFRPGDPGDRAFLIREGKIELLRGSDGRETHLATMGPGEVVGEMSLIEERPRALTARAVGAVKATGLTRDEFERMLLTDPATFRMYLKALFERLRALAEPVDQPPLRAELVPFAQPVAPTVQVVIHPLTRRSARTLPDDGLLIPKFPFRIGRASTETEREALDLNDLWLLEDAPFNISRNHAAIDVRGHDVFIRDRGSQLGMYVNEVRIGGHMDRRQADLHEGDNVVVLGGPSSPYQFRIHVAHA